MIGYDGGIGAADGTSDFVEDAGPAWDAAPARRSPAAALLAALPLLLGLLGCSARRGEPLKGPLDVSDPRVARGGVVYMAKCNKCHPGGEGGLGPALNNKPLPQFFVHYQTRNGTGAMPAFDEEELPDRDLADVYAYLKALRKRGSDGESGQGARDEGTAQRVTREGEQEAADVR